MSSDTQMIAEPPVAHDEDVFSILVATDIHLGFAEKDPIRANDTFETFEEVLKIAKENQVDFVLLGGDLFHETRPSTYCIFKCIDLLKRYCLGDRPVQVEFLSDPSHNFRHTGDDTVNYEDPNLNIDLPVFSVHGNHDDPTGEHQISAMNVLASTGLVNYFGKYTDHSSVAVEPILLKKGETKLALYGLSHIKDEKLARLIFDKKFVVAIPPETNWFHLLVLHQNRANRGVKTFIPDESLPEILDLVIWGHEHNCIIQPEKTLSNIHISQPGSTVATSLCSGEAITKHVGLLRIFKKTFNMTPVPLKTVRPFVFRETILKDINSLQNEAAQYSNQPLTHQALAEKQVEREIEAMIIEANQQGRIGDKLPLLRLNVAYTDEIQTFNTIRFGQKYIGRVANPKDIVKLKSAVKRNTRPAKDNEDAFMTMTNENLPSRVEDLVMQYFEGNEQKQLKCLSLKALNASVVKCIDANESEAPVDVTKYLIQELRKKLEAELVETDNVDDFLNTVRDQEEDMSLLDKVMSRSGNKKRSNGNLDIQPGPDSDENTSASANQSTSSRGDTASRPARGPGSGGGRGSRGGRGGRGQGKASN